MEVRHDDPNPVDEKSIVFPTDDIGYVFYFSKYAVTLDNGENWTTLDIERIPSIRGNGVCYIQDVQIAKDGKGTMTLRCSRATKSLVTSDFGINWFETQSD